MCIFLVLFRGLQVRDPSAMKGPGDSKEEGISGAGLRTVVMASPGSRLLPVAVRKSSLTPQNVKAGHRTRSKRPVGSRAVSVAQDSVVTTGNEQFTIQTVTVKALSDVGKTAIRKRLDARKRSRAMESCVERGGRDFDPQFLAGGGSVMGGRVGPNKEGVWKGFANEEEGWDTEDKGLFSVENDWSLGALDDMVLDSPPSSHSHDDPFAACPDSPLTLHTPLSLPSLDGTEDSDDGATGETASVMESAAEEDEDPEVGAELCPDRRSAMVAFLQNEAQRGFPSGMLELQLRGEEVWGPHSEPCARHACVRAARWSSKYCSNACGLLVAQDRLLSALQLQTAEDEGRLPPLPTTDPIPPSPTPASHRSFPPIPSAAEPQLQVLEADWRLVLRRAKQSPHTPDRQEGREGTTTDADRRGIDRLAALHAAFQTWKRSTAGLPPLDSQRLPLRGGRAACVPVSCQGCGAQVGGARLASHSRHECNVHTEGGQAWPWRPEAEEEGEWGDLADVLVTSELVHGTMWAAGGELGWLNLGTSHHATQDTDTSETREPFKGREAGVGSREETAGSRASGFGGEEVWDTEAPPQQQETVAAGGGTWKATLGALRLEAIRQGWMIIAEARANEGRSRGRI